MKTSFHTSNRIRFWVFIVLLVAIVVMSNAIASELDKRLPMKIDLTASSVYRLDAATIQMLEYLASLDKHIDIYVLAVKRNFSGSAYMMQALNIIEQYPRYATNITLEFVDYAADPSFAYRFIGYTLETGGIFVVCEDNVKQLRLSDLFNFSLSPEGSSMVISSSRAEEALSGAILSAANPETVDAVLLIGNGAASPEAFLSILEANDYVISKANPTVSDIDTEATLAMLFNPTNDYTENELDKLDRFLYNGGNYGKTLLFTADASSAPLPNLAAFMREWGVSLEDGAIYETNAQRTYQYIPFYPVADYTDMKYRNMMNDTSSTFLMPMARNLRALYENRDANVTETLLEFGASAVVRPSGAPANFTAEDADITGPLPALILAGRQVLENGVIIARSNIVVSASTGAFDNSFVNSTSLANSEYMLNLLNDLADRESTITIAPKSLAGRNLSIPSHTVSMLGIVFMGAIPLGAFLLGLAVWLIRRYG